MNKQAIVRLEYGPQGSRIACAAQDTTISVIKTPIFNNQLDYTTLSGHNGVVNSLTFNSNDQYLLSASLDNSVIVWNMKWQKKGEKLLILDRQKKNKSSQENSQTQQAYQQNPKFSEQIKRAQFYNQDKLIVLSSGNQLLFYQYELPDQQIADDVKRLQQKGLYKQIQQFTHPSAQQIPSFSLHNTCLLSNIGLIGGSNKELIVYDSNQNKEIKIINDTHLRHIHTVQFYEGSYSDSDSYNTFLTASTDCYIKLWDLRICKPVREFDQHQNRAIQIGFQISNCYRYLIAGSEDRSVYIYDISSSQLIEKTKNSLHKDSVTDISVNRQYNEWATSSIDGHIRIFRYPAKKVVKQKKGGGGGLVVKGKKAAMYE